MALATTTLSDLSNSTSRLSASATVLLATLASTTLTQPGEEYIRGLVAQLFSGSNQVDHRSTTYATTINYAGAHSTTKLAEPDEWQELEALEEDWDAAGAKRISGDAIVHARRFLAQIPALTHRFIPFPDATGSVGLQIREAGRSAYLLVAPDNRFTYVIRIGEKTHRGANLEAEEMKELLEFLY